MKYLNTFEKVAESLSYSGGDVTKMPIIGKVTAKAIGPFGPSEYNVVEVIKDGQGKDVYVCDFWYKEYKRIPQIIHSDFSDEFVSSETNENTSATGGPSVGGMGDVVNAQPSGLAGQTIGPSWASHGGTIGSGDVSVPYNPSGSNRVFQKIPVPAMGQDHGARTGKKTREKKLDMKALKNMFAKRQDYTAGQGNADRATKVMNFEDFAKSDVNKVKK